MLNPQRKPEESRTIDNLRERNKPDYHRTHWPIAKLDKIQFTSGLAKTRSGKIMRRIFAQDCE